jgi:hypothetical protein
MKIFFSLVISFLLSNICFSQVVVYPLPAANFGKVSDKYLVSVTQNGVTKQSYVYKSTAGSGPSTEWGTEINNNFHFTTFSFSGAVKISVTKLNSSATTAIVRPNRLAIGTKTTISQGANRTVSFSLSKPAKVSVEFSDDPKLTDAMMIFADTLETPSNVPAISAANVLLVSDANSLTNIPSSKTIVYFQPGVYTIGLWNIPSFINQIYFAGGAYVKGYLNYTNYNNSNSIKINGRGILSNTGYGFHYPASATDSNPNDWYFTITLRGGGANSMIEGITLIEASAYNIVTSANNVLIKNVKVNGFRYNNDGLTITGSGYIILDCFLRINDDTIVPYASNINVSNCVFWHLNTGSVFQLGWSPHSMSNINIANCDVIHDQASNSVGNVGFINAMNLSTTTTSAAINNVKVSNIYFDTPILRFLDIRADRNNVNSATKQQIWVYRNFKFTNIHFNQGASNTYPFIYLHGYDSYHPMVNYTFQNLYLNNVKVTTAKMNDSAFFNKKGIFGVVVK